MKKQMTVMDLGIVFVAVMLAIIAISASQQYARHVEVPNLPVIKSNVAVAVEEDTAERAVNLAGSEGQGQYSVVVISPATGQAEAVEYAAPRLSSLETAAAHKVSMAGKGQEPHRTVVVHPTTGAKLYEWIAPSVSSLSSGAVTETAQYSTVVVNSATWQAETVE